MGAMFGFMCFIGPDSSLAGAAGKRQKELALEMGFRIPELRGDVMAGNTIQRAIRNMSRRPGGPFVEELRRAVAVLDITKDDTLAMDQLIERNEGNELVNEFANSLKMVSRQGGQIGPVLNVLADLSQGAPALEHPSPGQEEPARDDPTHWPQQHDRHDITDRGASHCRCDGQHWAIDRVGTRR